MATSTQSFDNIEEAYPLLQLQLGMLFHSEYASETAVYHDIISYHLRAHFDVEALRATLRLLAARHTVLRTSFDLTTFSTPLQLVHRDVELPLQVEDLSHLSRDEQIKVLTAWRQKEQNQGFEWTRPPLLRFYVHCASSEEFLLTLSVHHAILDGWSVASLITELVQIYFSLLGQEAAPLLPPPMTTLRDFVALEQEALASQEQRAFWTNKLQHYPVTTLPRWLASYRRTSQVRSLDVLVPAEVWEGLRELAQATGVPLKTALLAVYLRVMSQQSGQQEIVTGLVSHGRPETRDGERVLGLFLNTLPIRLRLGGGTWRMLLQQTFEAEQELLPFRRYPMAEIQKSLGRRIQFDAVFNFTYFHVYQGLQDLEDLDLLGGSSFEETNFPLTFQFWVDDAIHHVQLSLSYNTAELCEPQIQAIAESCKSVLAAMVSDPDAGYHLQPFLTEAAYQQTIFTWNATQRTYSEVLCLHTLIEQQAQYTPDAVALVSAEIQLTYRELDQQANRLAQRLRALGVGPEVLVGLCVEPSLSMVVGVLGILKAGGAYVPLDPEYPTERLTFMMQDAQLAVLLTQRTLLERLPTPGMAVYLLDEQKAIQEEETKPAIQASGAQADNLAYVIYTSGSTGQPKGVMITHRGLINYLYWARQTYASPQGQGALLHSSLSFDLTVTSLFVPLLTSQPVEVPGEKQGVEELAKKMRNQPHWSLLKMTPAHLEALNAMELGHELQGATETLILGGEALWYQSLAYWRQLAPHCRLINEYGPTETVVGCIVYEVPKEMPEQGRVPIGRPIANTQIYILDAHLQPVPPGAVGSLYIGGAGLARGYHRQQALTAEKFIPHPFSTTPGARLYSTGDLARYRIDGSIEFLERQDTQIKLRGYRIETGEIEQAFLSHKAVQECIVMKREDVIEGGCLVAYVVGKAQNVAPEIQELRRFLQKKLPAYMVPASIVVLERLPLTANGKIDRHSLPIPDSGTLNQREHRNEKKFLSPMEELTLQSWQQVLRREDIGVQENFFEIGGHSLLATQVTARLRKLAGVELPLQAIFEAPTVAELALRVQQQLQQGLTQQVPPIVPMPRSTELLPSFAQQRLWFLDQLEPGNTSYNIPITIEIAGSLDLAVLDISLAQLIERHEGLRTIFREREGQPYQVIIPHGSLNTTLIDLQALSENQSQTIAMSINEQEALLSFDLSRGPLLRCTLLRLNSQKHWLRLNMHHIVSDGWSMGVFVEELTNLYQACKAGKASALLPLTIQYADYAHWQRNWLQGDVLKEHLRYWTQQLSSAQALQLPTDYPRPHRVSHQGATCEFQLTPDLSQALEQLSRQEGATLFMTLLAAFQVLLYRLSGQEDVVVGTDSANRSHLETEGLIGFFVNLLALRTNLHGNPQFLSVLHTVREMILGTYAHQELPFEMIIEHLRLEREGSRTPLINVLFVMQNIPISEARLSDVTIRQIENEAGNAKFDLTLFIAQDAANIYGSLHYNSDLFEHKTILILLQRYETLLRSIVLQPRTKVVNLDITTEEEKAQRDRQQSVQRQNLKGSRGERLRITMEDGHSSSEIPR